MIYIYLLHILYTLSIGRFHLRCILIYGCVFQCILYLHTVYRFLFLQLSCNLVYFDELWAQFYLRNVFQGAQEANILLCPDRLGAAAGTPHQAAILWSRKGSSGASVFSSEALAVMWGSQSLSKCWRQGWLMHLSVCQCLFGGQLWPHHGKG